MPQPPTAMTTWCQQAMNLAHFSSLGCFSWCHNTILHEGQGTLLLDTRPSLAPPNSPPPIPSVCLPPGHLANASTDLMKLDHEEEPQLSEPYLSKQKKLMVSGSKPHTSLVVVGDITHGPAMGTWCLVPLHGYREICPSVRLSIRPSTHPSPVLTLLST